MRIEGDGRIDGRSNIFVMESDSEYIRAWGPASAPGAGAAVPLEPGTGASAVLGRGLLLSPGKHIKVPSSALFVSRVLWHSASPHIKKLELGGKRSLTFHKL